MNVIAFILFIAAAVVFLLGSFPGRQARPVWLDVPLGLFLLTVGFIVQLGSTAHTITF